MCDFLLREKIETFRSGIMVWRVILIEDVHGVKIVSNITNYKDLYTIEAFSYKICPTLVLLRI